MQITAIHITTFQQSTWGRVYVQYEKNGQKLYAFKNFIHFKEVNYIGDGELINEPAYSWFNNGNRFTFSLEDVLSGKADQLYLTPPNWKKQYGTPSVLLKRLLIDIYSENLTPVEHRRGWFKNFYIPKLHLSEIHITKDFNQIVLNEYSMELTFEPLMKTLYVFFLKHPEGVKRTDMIDYLPEIKEIYKQISKKSDFEKVNQSIQSLLDNSGKSFDEKISKIKKYLIDHLDEKLAKHYFVYKTESEVYTISLPTEKIKFD
jgi:hypothetical protein